MLSIRCSRRGRKRKPFFGIMVADSRMKRDGRFIEKLGHYDPIKKEVVVRMQRFMDWTKVGAIASKTVTRLLRSSKRSPQQCAA